MSKIIKNSQLSDQPRIIELAVLSELTEIEGKHNEPLNMPREKEEFEELRNESKQILIDTENMVVELLQKARDEAKLIINEAQEEADMLKGQAVEEAINIRKKAEAEGYNAGLEMALSEMETSLQQSRKESEEMLEKARQEKLAIMSSAELEIVKLAIAVARKVIAAELITNPEVIGAVVREALTYLDDTENVSVRVNPSDIDKIQLLSQNGHLSNGHLLAEIKADKRISPGGCILETPNGSVDALLETRQKAVEKVLLDVAGND